MNLIYNIFMFYIICLVKRLEKSHYFRMAIYIVVIIKKKTVGIEEDSL